MHPPVGGPALRIESSIQALSRISELYIHCRAPWNEIGGQDALSFYRKFGTLHFAPSVRSHAKSLVLRKFVDYIAGNVLQRQVFGEPASDYRDLLLQADGIEADAIWLGRGIASYSILRYIRSYSNYRVVLDTASVLSREVLRELPFAGGFKRHRILSAGKAVEREEMWGTQSADITTAVSEVDAEYYRSLVLDKHRIHLFPNVIDTQTYIHPPRAPPELKNPCVYVAGTIWPGSPMEYGVRWVIRNVLPLVRRKISDIHFYIVGKGGARTLSDVKDPRITITGEVPSVLPYLCHADVAIVPLWWESGTRFKILEAGACSIPVISTTLGAEGLSVMHGKDLLIADSAETFAEAIVKLIRDRDFAAMIAKNLKECVYEKYTIANLANYGKRILHDLIVNRSKLPSS
jgi:glycosyltransferase involved in cell wall biosynthesis